MVGWRMTFFWWCIGIAAAMWLLVRFLPPTMQRYRDWVDRRDAKAGR